MSIWYKSGVPQAVLRRDAVRDPARTVPLNFAYFVNAGGIVRQKSYEELGIDASDPMRAFREQNLLPILEPLIRGRVPPQEPEMEEMEIGQQWQLFTVNIQSKG